jgi:nitrate reductase NapAB chaperone NapD
MHMSFPLSLVVIADSRTIAVIAQNINIITNMEINTSRKQTFHPML